MRMRVLGVCTVLSISAGGCGDDGSSGSGGGDDEATSAEEGTEAGESEETGPAFDPVPATGIDIIRVEANQGVQIDLSRNGTWLDGNQRNTNLIEGRDTYYRVHFEVHEGWVPRDIEARVDITFPNGETQQATQTLFVEEDSNPRFLDSPFFLQTFEDWAVAGATYEISLWDVTPEGASLSAGRNTSPEGGPALVGFEDRPLRMRVMAVPILWTGGAEPREADLSEMPLQTMTDGIYATNPLQELEIEVHEPVEYSGSLSNLGSLLPVMSQLRAAENAPDYIYYHALANTGAQTGVVGIANLGGFVAASLWNVPEGGMPTKSTETVIHEIGHNQGLAHIYCPNASSPAAGPDPTYPYADGHIGIWGFSIRSFELYPPDIGHDYMTYCASQWPSDWTWSKTRTRIIQFTEAELGGKVIPKVPTLHGVLYPEGGEEWWVAPAAVDLEAISGNHRFRFEHDGRVEEQLGTAAPLTDGETVWMTVPLPEELDLHGLDRIVRVSDGVESTVSVPDLVVVRPRP